MIIFLWVYKSHYKEYLELAERTIKEEETRAQTYLESSTLRPLVKVCHSKFIGNGLCFEL